MEAILASSFGMPAGSAAIGLAVGTLIGLTGMGGGSLLTPALIVLLGLDPLTAVGTGLIVAAGAKLAGSVAHSRLGHVDLPTTRALLAGSLPGALLGATLLGGVYYTQVMAVSDLVQVAIGVTLLLAAASLWTRPLWEKGGSRAARNPALVRSSTLAVAFVVGLLVALTSVGSGTLLVPFLLFVRRLPPAQVVGTDIVHGLVLTATVAVIYGAGGHVDASLAATLLAGAVPGVILGSYLSLVVSRPAMERILGGVLVLTSLKFF